MENSIQFRVAFLLEARLADAQRRIKRGALKSAVRLLGHEVSL
jgi:hypothetical protein